MTHLIETYADHNRGDYLINHWFASLKANVELEDIDVVVFDYGLTKGQISQLRDLGIVVETRTRDGRISNIHYRDLAEYLHQHSYDQVLYSDCGDIIFQSDIRHLFESDKDAFRAACENVLNLRMQRITLGINDLKRRSYVLLERLIRNRPLANGGFILAPAAKMAGLWSEYSSLCDGCALHGTDQLIMNYVFYRDGFVRLPEEYNFVLITTRSRFRIERGRFYGPDGNLIPVVHNAGRFDWARSVAQFGYGSDRNQLKFVTHWLMVIFYSALNWLTSCLPSKSLD
jgi:hypothetical protein